MKIKLDNGIGIIWWVEGVRKDKKVHVLLSNKLFRCYWNFFDHGYRNLGIKYFNFLDEISLGIYFGKGAIIFTVRING